MLHKSLQLDVIGKLLTECKKRRPRPKGRFLRDKFSHNSSLPKNGFSIAKGTEQVFSQLQFQQRRCSIAQLSRPERNPDSDVSMLGKRSTEKKTFSFGHCPNDRGGVYPLPMAEFFGPLSRSAFLVNKKSLFLQKCQCIELLTVF